MHRKTNQSRLLGLLEIIYQPHSEARRFSLGRRSIHSQSASQIQDQQKSPLSNEYLTQDAAKNAESIGRIFHSSINADFITVPLPLTFENGINKTAYLLFLNGVTDKNQMNTALTLPIHSTVLPEGNLLESIENKVLSTLILKRVNLFTQAKQFLLQGHTLLLLPEETEALSIDFSHLEVRSIGEPKSENVIRGPQESFIESLEQNIGLIRKNLPSEFLITEWVRHESQIHSSKTAILYLKGVANPKLIEEVTRRVTGIQTDYLINGTVLQQLIEDSPYSLTPSLTVTERPDRACQMLIDGHVILLSGNSPLGVICPTTFWTLFHTAEEVYMRTLYANFIRFVRLLACFIALFSPGFYVALTNFQTEMLPSDLMLHIAGSREQLPFPTMLSIIMMEIAFELIYEAGVRLPKAMGSTIGIVGALILGQAAVQANLISPLLVILVSITGLGSFAIPSQDLSYAIRIARFIFLFLAGTLGFFGIALGVVMMIGHLVSLQSFGVPFLAPMYPKMNANKDFIFRSHIWKQNLYGQHTRPMKKVRTNKEIKKWTKSKENSP